MINRPLLLSVFICLALRFFTGTTQARASSSDLANQIVALVNELREEEGLPALNVHPTLTQLAQAQADYMALSGQSSHLDALGRRPFQRALAAGYPVAGDLSLGGFYSENIMTGPSLSAKQLVEMWMGDDLHQNTMLSEYRSDMGAGVAFAGDVGYYVLDTALASSYHAVITLSSNPPPGQSIYVIVPQATSTPLSDGSIQHTVRTGETLWGIAAVYGSTVDEIALLNRISPQRFLQPGDQLVIRQASTATPEGLSVSEINPQPFVDGSYAMATRTPVAAKHYPAAQAQGLPLTRLIGWVLLAVAILGGILLAMDWLRDRKNPDQD
jgi:LysM repeat protein